MLSLNLNFWECRLFWWSI